MKSAPGVNVQLPSPLSFTVPLSTVTPLALNVSPSTSVTLDRKSAWVMSRLPSSARLKLAGDAMSTSGASLTAVTVIVPASATVLVPSLIV